MRAFGIAAAVLAACAIGACSSATTGTGAGSGASSGPTSGPSTAASSSAVPTQSSSLPAPSASATPSVSLSLSVPPATSSAPPQPVRAPKACAAGQCHQVGSADLGTGYAATVYAGPSPSGQIGAAYLRLALGGVPVFWKVIDGENPGQLLCSPTPLPNCVLVDGFGAHASSARGFVRRASTLVQFGTVQSDTPVTNARDLNDDGWIDALDVVNTYQPDYATGKVFWSTSLSDGTKFTVSGCTPPKKKLAPAPSAPLKGACTSS